MVLVNIGVQLSCAVLSTIRSSEEEQKQTMPLDQELNPTFEISRRIKYSLEFNEDPESFINHFRNISVHF